MYLLFSALFVTVHAIAGTARTWTAAMPEYTVYRKRHTHCNDGKDDIIGNTHAITLPI